MQMIFFINKINDQQSTCTFFAYWP